MAHIDELISQQYWKPTTHSGEHEYFMQPQNPDLHDILKTLIKSEGYTAHFVSYKFPEMPPLPELVHASAQGGTIHSYYLSGGKRSFQRYLGCYLGACKFCNDIEEATEYLENLVQIK